VSSKFRLSFPAIERLHGLETAKTMHRLAHDGVRVVEQFIDEFKLGRARFEHTGSLRCAHTEHAFASIRAEAEWVKQQLGDTTMTVQSRAEVEKLLRDTKLDQQMQAFGQWEDFKSGKRGRF